MATTASLVIFVLLFMLVFVAAAVFFVLVLVLVLVAAAVVAMLFVAVVLPEGIDEKEGKEYGAAYVPPGIIVFFTTSRGEKASLEPF